MTGQTGENKKQACCRRLCLARIREVLSSTDTQRERVVVIIEGLPGFRQVSSRSPPMLFASFLARSARVFLECCVRSFKLRLSQAHSEFWPHRHSQTPSPDSRVSLLRKTQIDGSGNAKRFIRVPIPGNQLGDVPELRSSLPIAIEASVLQLGNTGYLHGFTVGYISGYSSNL